MRFLFLNLLSSVLFLPVKLTVVFVSVAAISVLRAESQKCSARESPPVLEEFIPLKKEHDQSEENDHRDNSECRDRRNWMSSVQLWNNNTNNNDSDCKQQHNHKLETKVD